jgi:large subunit ribosomal protein L6
MEEKVELTEGVTASFDKASHTLTVTGPKGSITKQLHHPKLSIEVVDGAVTFGATQATLNEKKRLFTFKAHTKNMVKGVTDGFTYKLKICSGHFPMSVAVKGKEFEVKNFIGEKVPRLLKIKEGADVKVNGQEIEVTGFDKEIVSQVAADIEQLTRRPGFDTRIFQDGIFITEKDGKQV